MLAVHRYSFLLEVMWVVSAPSYIMSGGWSFNLPHPLTHSTLVAFELEESTKQLLNQPLQLIKTVRICVAFLLYFCTLSGWFAFYEMILKRANWARVLQDT